MLDHVEGLESRVQSLTERILADYENGRVIDRLEMFSQPDQHIIEELIGKLLRLVFPGYYRDYTYRIYNSRLGNPFYVDRAWFYPKHLDEKIMQEAASQFVGTHDFAAVRSVGTDVKSTVRTVYYYKVERQGDLIELKVCANGFLYNMVRIIAGTLIKIGMHEMSETCVPSILEAENREAAGPTAPAQGLTLVGIEYPDLQ